MELNTVMTANPACCKQDTPLRQVAQMMSDNDCGMIPVVDQQDMPVGVITDRDIAVRAVAGGKDTTRASASDYMTTPVRTVGCLALRVRPARGQPAPRAAATGFPAGPRSGGGCLRPPAAGPRPPAAAIPGTRGAGVRPRRARPPR